MKPQPGYLRSRRALEPLASLARVPGPCNNTGFTGHLATQQRLQHHLSLTMASPPPDGNTPSVGIAGCPVGSVMHEVALQIAAHAGDSGVIIFLVR